MVTIQDGISMNIEQKYIRISKETQYKCENLCRFSNWTSMCETGKVELVAVHGQSYLKIVHYFLHHRKMGFTRHAQSHS